MLNRWGGIVAVIVVVVLAAGAQVEAQTDKQVYDGRILTDKLVINVGGLATNFKTDIAAGNVLGTVIRLEDVLGYDEDLTTGSIYGFYRLGTKNKHAISFGFGQFNRSTSGTISGTIPIFDEEFVGDFRSNFDVQTVVIAYRYSFVNTGKTEAGFQVGLSTYDFEFGFSGEFQIGGDPMNLQASTEKADFLAPLPTYGFFINYAIKRKLIIGMGVDALDLDLGDVSGRLLNSDVRFTWYPTKYFGVGIAFLTTDINYDNTDENTGDKLRVDYKQTGATLFLTFGF